MSLTYNQKILEEIKEVYDKWQSDLKEIFDEKPERLQRFSTVSDRSALAPRP